MTAQKRALRARSKAARQDRSEAEREALHAGMTEQLSRLVVHARAGSVACYLSSQTEPSTRGFLREAAATGLPVLLPLTRDDGLLDWTVHVPGAERPHPNGFPEAVGERLPPASVAGVDLILAPAAAVDQNGHRLGWGKGFYDRTLACAGPLPPVYALVFDDEVLGNVPHDAHDIRVNGLVTPTRTQPLP